MTNARRIVCLTAALLMSMAYAIDLPVGLNFRLGFSTQVLPGPDDASRDLDLVVTTDRIISDKTHTLLVSGSIINTGDAVCENIEMRFAVTSYIKTGVSRGRATVEPASIPPGGTAAFTAHILLDDEKPRYAFYTITAASPARSVAAEITAEIPGADPDPVPEEPGAPVCEPAPSAESAASP